MFLETVLNDNFVDYQKVYKEATDNGMKKSEVKRQKAMLEVKTLEVKNEEGEKIWLWFIPKNVWKRYSQTL